MKVLYEICRKCKVQAYMLIRQSQISDNIRNRSAWTTVIFIKWIDLLFGR